MPSDPREIKMLKYAIYVLVFILTSITGWNSLCITRLPDNYVRLERYKEDRIVYRNALIRIEDKLDHLISKQD